MVKHFFVCHSAPVFSFSVEQLHVQMQAQNIATHDSLNLQLTLEKTSPSPTDLATETQKCSCFSYLSP